LIQLSKRLATIADFVKSGSRVADIGSDHALLPTYLVNNKISPYVIAGEVNNGPFLAATRQITEQGLEGEVSVRKGNGLEVIDHSDNISVITIAGMGGALITEILQNGIEHVRYMERLILQPNVGDEIVRKWLDNNYWNIIDEVIIEEDQKIYPIIVAEPRKNINDDPNYLLDSTRTKKELYRLGPILWQKKPSVLMKKWEQELKKTEYILVQLQKAKGDNEEKIKSMLKEQEWIKEVLLCMPMDKPSSNSLNN